MARLSLIAIVLFTGACVTSGAGVGGASTGESETDRNRLTTTQIRAANLPNAYELVNRLRRAWLRRDPRTGGAVAVYMDQRPIGGAEALREIPTVNVGELRFMPHREAVIRWGPAVEGSVIVVIRRR